MGGEWMIGKFATASALPLLILTILLGAKGFGQAAPPAQPAAAPTPAAQQPSPQQPPAQQPAAQPPATEQDPSEEPLPRRKAKPKDYKNWTFDIGAGANLDSGTTETYVRGGGGVGTVGVARNANKYLGLRADFIFANLPLRDSTLPLAQATGDNNNLYAVTLDPIINIPASKLYHGYFLLGGGFYHRTGSLSGDTFPPGSGCNGFWTWWGSCTGGVSLPVSGNFVDSNQNSFGYNFGAGITRTLPSGVELYLEARLMHGKNSNVTTDVRPITIGVRW